MNFSSSRYFYLIELEEGSLGRPFCRILIKRVPDTYFDPTRILHLQPLLVIRSTHSTLDFSETSH
ncbi:hypothetical protein BpHYR1_002484 [Brachionus plicatilis]|uniref:Uncharacterized protein n=1 Tax=Brachionus plicatilis TaxID=10195 RepID=A0A3M7QFY2_BRAPC|nr:hypothetical protein BpHYR1_002484 [Brachionus plicatilis]